jgi:hypothetical protein
MIGFGRLPRNRPLVESQPGGWVPAVGFRASAEHLPGNIGRARKLAAGYRP